MPKGWKRYVSASTRGTPSFRSTASTSTPCATATHSTRLGTLHIQQNPGALDPTDPKDKHLEPFSGGLIDWGEFYYELLKNNRYRGCFLYEVSFKQVYDGDGSTIESAKSNYTNLIYPAFVRTVAAKK